MVKYLLLLLFVFCVNIALAQSSLHPFFYDGARVCFVGNSITNNGEFHHNLLLYNTTRFPEQKVAFFNCGISGDVTGGVLARMEDDILVHRPTHAVIMLGMNDVQRSLYGSKETQDNDTLTRRAEAIYRYKQNLEKIITEFLSKDVQVILQKPTIYDQTAKLAAKNNLGVNDALKNCADFIEEMAYKYQLPVIDYWNIMERLNRDMQQKSPSATITGPDRVHPASTGHLVMAYQFLNSVQAPKYVSKIYIEKGSQPRLSECLNCEILSYSAGISSLSFTVKEHSLPFPTNENQREALDLVPFVNEFNIQLLTIGNLKKGQYELSIDGKTTGIFSDSQLKEGINLAIIKNTPQYEQATIVRDELAQLWKAEAKLRGIKFIEYNSHFKASPKKDDLFFLKNYLDSVFTENYGAGNNYHRVQMERYFENKPNEKALRATCDSLRQNAYRIAKPVGHVFSVVAMLENRK